MAKHKYRVVAEDTVVLGHPTGEEFTADLQSLGLNEEALISSGAIEAVKTPKPKEE